MTRTTTAAIRQALGAYGERVAAATPGRAGDGPARPQLAVRARARSTWCCATATCSWSARSRRAAACGYGTPHEAVTDARCARLRRLATALAGGARRRRARRPDRPGRRASGRAAAPSRSSTCGGSADAVRHRPHRLAARRRRPPDRRPGRRLARARSASRSSAAPTRRSTRPGTAAGWRSSTAGSTGRPPGGSRSCSRRPTCSSAAPTSTSAIAVAVLAAAGSVPRRVAGRARRSSAS